MCCKEQALKQQMESKSNWRPGRRISTTATFHMRDLKSSAIHPSNIWPYTSSTKDRFCTTRRSKRIRTAPVICGGPGRGAQYEALNAARADRRYWLYWATSAARTAEARLPAACITPPPKRGPNTLPERGHWRPRSVTKHVGGTGRRRWGDPLRRLNSRHVRHSRGRLSINEH